MQLTDESTKEKMVMRAGRDGVEIWGVDAPHIVIRAIYDEGGNKCTGFSVNASTFDTDGDLANAVEMILAAKNIVTAMTTALRGMGYAEIYATGKGRIGKILDDLKYPADRYGWGRGFNA